MKRFFFFRSFFFVHFFSFQMTNRQAVLTMLDTTSQRASDREVIYDNEMNTT